MSQEERFAELLSSVGREIARRQASEVCCGGLTLEQFQTLRHVAALGGPSMGALSARLRVDVSTMSRNVTVLERDGHLERARSDEDARVVHVRVTPKGRRALETLRCDERDVLGAVYARLPGRARAHVVDALETLRGCLEEATDAGAACCAPTPIRRGAP